MTIAIVGSREFSYYRYLEQSIEIYFSKIDKIISGGARGADNLGQRYANEHNIPLTLFLPDWNAYGKSAGYRRNVQIVTASDAVVAYWDGNSRGTHHTINIANKAGKPVLIFLYTMKQIVTLNWEPMIKGLIDEMDSAKD